MTSDRPRTFSIGLCGLIAALLSAPATAIDSTWKTGGPSRDWNEPLNWTNGVPQLVNDAARFNLATGTPPPRPQLNAPASLGQLVVAGLGAFELTGSGPLTFSSSNPRSGPLLSVQASNNLHSMQLTALINVPIVLPASQTLSVGLTNGASIRLHGDISGDGALSFSGRPTGYGSEVRGNNTYTGLTTIDVGVNHLIDVASPTAFGDTTRETILRSGRIALWEGTAESFTVESQGMLVATPSATLYTGKITLAGGALVPSWRFNNEDDLPVVIDSEVSVQGRGFIGLSPNTGNAAVLNGQINGSGLLVFQGSSSETITTLGPLQHRGDVLAADRSNVVVAGKFNPAGDLKIDGGISYGYMRLEGDVSQFSNDIETRQGGLLVATDVHARNLKVDARLADWRESLQNGGVTVEAGKTLDVDSLEFYAGHIDGRLTGVAQITKQTRIAGFLSRLEGFDGVVAVEEGMLNVQASSGLGTTVGHTSVLRNRGAAIALYEDARVEDAIYLNNASGFGYQGALLGPGEMAGQLHLGDQGAYLGGNGGTVGTFELSGNLRISGSIHGGALYKNGPSTDLFITGPGHTYSGDTNVLGGQLILEQAGRLETTSAILVGGGRITNGGQATASLLIDNRGAVGLQDRVADSVPVRLHSGRIEVQGDSGQSSETIGKVTLEGGWNRMDATGGVLHINQLDRKAGSIAAFLPSSSGRVEIDSAALDDGLLGGWALYHQQEYRPQGFATVSGGVVSRAASVVRSLNGSTSTQNVELHASEALTNDVTVNSLITSGTADVNLGGKRLAVDSGGVLALGYTTFSNGTLTAGSGGPSELILHNYWTLDVAANIVDNGGPLGLHASGIGIVNLSGTNTYTGGTRISRSSGIRVLNRSAVPVGDVVDVDSGRYQVDVTDSQPLQLERLIMRGSALVEGTSNAPIDANHYEVYSGSIWHPITGDGHFVKRGEGEFSLDENSSGYVGAILVEQGTLDLSATIGAVAPNESSAITVREGGVLVARSLPDARLLVLEGGELRAYIASGSVQAFPIEVRGSGTISGIGGFNSPISGQGDLTIDGPYNNYLSIQRGFGALQGDVTLTGGDVSISANNSDYSGTVHIRASGAAVGANSFGPLGGVVHPEGILTVQSSLASRLQMNGGILRTGTTNTVVHHLDVAADSDIQTTQGQTTQGPYPGAPSTNLQISQSATFADGVRLKKSGAGRLTFDGANTFGEGVEIVAWEGAVDLRGTIQATPGSSLNFRGNNNFTFASSLHLPANSSFELLSDGVQQQLRFASTRLTGLGTVLGDVDVRGSGVISPGLETSTGELHIDGDATIGAGGKLKIELAGSQNAAYDQFDVSGAATLDGALLEVALLGGFVPTLSDVFTILRANSISGAFFNASSLYSLSGGRRIAWALNSTGADVLLQASSIVLQSDFDANGVVDGADLALWRSGFGSTGAASHGQGDANGDGKVDGADLLVWQRQYGGSTNTFPTATVPEPASILMLAVGLLAIAQGRRFVARV